MFPAFRNNEHQQYLAQLPKLSQSVIDVNTLYSPIEFRATLLEKISSAKKRICIVALYLENDDAGHTILSALYSAKRIRPTLNISVLVDWHRAQRNRIGDTKSVTNADWYYEMAIQNSDITLPVYGVPVNTREALGVLHLKGFIIDDTLLYSGASLNNVYLHQYDKYRYDRYQVIRNSKLSDIMFTWIEQNLKQAVAVHQLNQINCPKNLEIKNKTRQFRHNIRDFGYHFTPDANNIELAVTPLIGIGKRSLLNRTIYHLIPCTKCKLIICTPYFNLPKILIRSIIRLLRNNKEVEIIVGDKTANDFYIPEDQPFKIIGILPYLYEINLKRFLRQLQYYSSNGQLTIRLWKDGKNSYHSKGIWVDNEWMLITGNNLNPRAWNLDLENAILIHDPLQQLTVQRNRELNLIRQHTTIIHHFRDIDSISDYPNKTRNLIKHLHRTHIDRLINRLL